MSRIGKKPVIIPAGVTVDIAAVDGCLHHVRQAGSGIIQHGFCADVRLHTRLMPDDRKAAHDYREQHQHDQQI